MAQHNGGPIVKKVEHPIVDPRVLRTQLIDSVPQVVGLGAAESMAKLPQPFDTDHALVLCLSGQRVDPIQEWARAVVLLIEDYWDHRLGHCLSLAILLIRSSSIGC